jgi:hypothetical protein
MEKSRNVVIPTVVHNPLQLTSKPDANSKSLEIRDGCILIQLLIIHRSAFYLK